MARKLTVIVTLDEGVTDIGVEHIKNDIIDTLLEDGDVAAVHILPEQMELPLKDN